MESRRRRSTRFHRLVVLISRKNKKIQLFSVLFTFLVSCLFTFFSPPGWTYLLQFVDTTGDIDDGREAYDAFLHRYPYCYGYWKKYADLEKRKGKKRKLKKKIILTDFFF